MSCEGSLEVSRQLMKERLEQKYGYYCDSWNLLLESYDAKSKEYPVYKWYVFVPHIQIWKLLPSEVKKNLELFQEDIILSNSIESIGPSFSVNAKGRSYTMRIYQRNGSFELWIGLRRGVRFAMWQTVESSMSQGSVLSSENHSEHLDKLQGLSQAENDVSNLRKTFCLSECDEIFNVAGECIIK